MKRQRPDDLSQRGTEAREVLLKVGGQQFSVSQEVLSALGSSSYLAVSQGRAEADGLVLPCSARTFEEFRACAAEAVHDIRAGVARLVTALQAESWQEEDDDEAGGASAPLEALLELLGLDWLRGSPYAVPQALALRAASGSAAGNGGLREGIAAPVLLEISKLKDALDGGILRHLAAAGALPNPGEGFGRRGRAPPDAVRLARMTTWARSLADDAAAIVQLLDLRAAPCRELGCYQPRIIRDGDRLVFDVGATHLVRLDCLLLGLAAIPEARSEAEAADEDSEDPPRLGVQVVVELVGTGSRRTLSACSRPKHLRPGGAGSGRWCSSILVPYRRHEVLQDAAGGWSVPPQTCAAVLLDTSTAADLHSDGGDDDIGAGFDGSRQSYLLVDRVFEVTLRFAGGALALYHAELFGDLLELPPELANGSSSADFSLGCIGRGTLRCEEPYYLEELQLLRHLGLLDRGLERKLAEQEGYADWDPEDGDEDAVDEYGEDDEW